MKRLTKTARRANASKRSKVKRVAAALRKYLQQQNPGTKLAGAKVQKLKGGVLKITPIKANAGYRASPTYHGHDLMTRVQARRAAKMNEGLAYYYQAKNGRIHKAQTWNGKFSDVVVSER